MNDILLATITELAINAKAAGEAVSLAIITDGSSVSAYASCPQVFSDGSD